MEFKGSKTEQNLMYAFSGESQARTKYDFYASKAKKDGFEQISAIFAETALNERSTPSSGSKSFTGLATPTTIFWTQPPAKTPSGRKCIGSLPRLPKKRASRT